MADPRHEARRAIAGWKVARYEARISAAISKALAVHKRKALAANVTPGSPNADPFDLASWQDTVQANVAPAVHSVLEDIVGAVAIAGGLAGGAYLLGRAVGSGETVAQAVDAATAGIVQQATAVGESLAGRLSLTISTATDAGQLASSMNSLFTTAEVSGSLVARSANFFANALATQAALTVVNEGSPMQKTWVTMGDDRVRPDHEDVDGTTLGVEDQFTVGGDSLLYPGDPNGSEAEVANCRCWLVFEPASGAAASSGDESATESALAASAEGVTASGRERHTLPVTWLGGRSIRTASPPPAPRNRAERRAAARRRA